MRIGLCGPSGTGKTTIARMLSERFHVPINPVGSRSTAEVLGFTNPYDVDLANQPAYNAAVLEGLTPDLAAQAAVSDYNNYGSKGNTCRTMFQRRLQTEKIEWENNHDRFITDRTTIDDYCYTAMHAPYSLSDEFELNAAKHMLRYDLVLFCSMDAFINVGDDPARQQSLAYHRAFERMVKACLDQWISCMYGKVPPLPTREDYIMEVAMSVVNR